MSAKLSLAGTILFATSLLVSCASSNFSQTNGNTATAVYYESAFNDHNRAPASMSPPSFVTDGVDNLDPTYMRTQADYYFQTGEAQSLEGQHQKAVEAFKMVLLYDSKSAQVHLRLAAEYVKLGMISEALEHAEISIKKDPKLADARLLLGGLYSTLKVYDKAIAQYEEVLRLEPSNTEAPMYIGAVFAEQKQYDKAIKYFEALAKNPEYGTPYLAWYYVGRIRSEQTGKSFLKASEAAYHKALKLKPDHLETVLALGSLYTKSERESKAVDLYKNFQREHGVQPRLAELLSQAYLEQERYDLAYEQLEILEANSDDSLNAKVKMALVLIEQKKFEKAVTKLKEVLRQVPDSDKIRFYLAAIYEEINKTPEAIEQFSRIPAESQYYGESIVHAAYLLKQSKKIDQAIDLIKAGLEKRKDVSQFYAIYASLLDEKSEYKKAAQILDEGTTKFPENVQLRFFLGTIQDRMGNKKKVIENMKMVIEMDPNHVQGLNYLAFTYADSNNNLEEAEKLVRRALEIEPNDGYILDTMGWILFKRGNFPESIKMLEAAYKNQPNESIIAEHLGDAYNKHQLTEKARQMYQKAAESEVDDKKVHQIREKITALDQQELKFSSERRPASMPSSAPKQP
jgi:tetratricopeptide (TPR) repeat protein